MIIKVKELGLVAYMQMRECVLSRYVTEKGVFELESEESLSLEDWSLEYSNSCCSQHDRNILTLRNLVRNSKR